MFVRMMALQNTGGVETANVWHFDSQNTSSDQDVHDECVAALQTFYTSLATWLPDREFTFTSYDMSDPKPRVPLASTQWTYDGVPASNVYPSEVALCLSYKADVASGDIARRRRGRIYLGPWGAVAATSSSGVNRPIGTLITALTNAAADLAAPFGTNNIHWAVFSPTTVQTGGTLDAAYNDVTNGWVDNEWDTQRRRGAGVDAKTTWTANLP